MGYARKIEEMMDCTMNGCGTLWYPGACRKCGFNWDEAQRRRRLPLETRPNGTKGIVLRRWDDVSL